MDVFSPERRSEIMRCVHSRGTQPEMAVRKAIREAGYRYRLHAKGLPGTPDIVLAGLRKAIFVHGCFWHRHTCPSATLPKSNRDYWEGKQTRNTARDKRNIRRLRIAGWRVLVVWECEVKNSERLRRRLPDIQTQSWHNLRWRSAYELYIKRLQRVR